MSNKKEENLVVEIVSPEELKTNNILEQISFMNKEDVSIKDIQYMCHYFTNYEGCEYCPLNSGRICGYAILLKLFNNNSQELNQSILNWLRDNPPTSFLMDIKEKMPNIELGGELNTPNFCVKNIYGKDCCECQLKDISKFDRKSIICKNCWKLPIDEEIRKEYGL